MDKALKFNQGKPQYSLIHYKSLEPLVRVLEAGAAKYERNNWKLGLKREDIIDSMLRHVTELADGKLYDEDTKVHSIGGVIVNAMFYGFSEVDKDGGVIMPGTDWLKHLETIQEKYKSYK